MPKNQRLPRADIPAGYACPYDNCTWKRPENKRPELTFRNHMAQQHDVYYELAPLTDVGKKLANRPRHAGDVAAIEELTTWQCVAIARHVIEDWTFTKIAKNTNHSPKYVAELVKSPAGKAYIAKLEEECKDPVKLIRNLMAGDTVNKWAGWQLAWDWAVDNKDYVAIHKMAKDIGLQPVLEQDEKDAPSRIVLNLNMGGLATEDIKTSFTVVEDPEFDVEDDGRD